MFTDTSECGFQKFITNYLVTKHKFIETTPTKFNREFCLNTKQVLIFMMVQEIKQKEVQIEVLKKKYRKEIASIEEYREALITDLVTGKRSIPQFQIR